MSKAAWTRNMIIILTVGFFASIFLTPTYIFFFQPGLIENPAASWLFTGIFTLIILGVMWVLGWWDSSHQPEPT